jgi:hypothetical protein
MNPKNRKLLLAGLGAWLCLSGFADTADLKPQLSFPFCIDWHEAKKRSFADAREHLARSMAAWKKLSENSKH